MSELETDAAASSFPWPVLARGAQPPPRVPAGLRGSTTEDDARERARTEGYAAGLQEGRAAARKEIEAHQARLRESLAALDGIRLEVSAGQLHALADVARAVCRRVLDVELRTNAEVFRHLIALGVEHLGDSVGRITVHVCPMDDWYVDDAGGTVDVVVDESLPTGALRLRNECRTVGFDLHRALDALFTTALDG